MSSNSRTPCLRSNELTDRDPVEQKCLTSQKFLLITNQRGIKRIQSELNLVTPLMLDFVEAGSDSCQLPVHLYYGSCSGCVCAGLGPTQICRCLISVHFCLKLKFYHQCGKSSISLFLKKLFLKRRSAEQHRFMAT